MFTKKSFWRWFWILTLVISCGYAWYCFYSPDIKVGWLTDTKIAEAAATKSGKPLLVFVTAKWCVPCRIMKRTVLADASVQKAIESKHTALIVDFDDPSAKDFLERYSIRGTPVTLLFESNGNLSRYIDRGVGKDEFMRFLQQ